MGKFTWDDESGGLELVNKGEPQPEDQEEDQEPTETDKDAPEGDEPLRVDVYQGDDEDDAEE